MDNDLIQLLIYVGLGLIGVLASAYRNKMQKKQASTKPHVPVVPRNLPADPGKDFGPELGPLIELFNIPGNRPAPFEYETIESGPTAEESGMKVDTAESAAELEGMTAEAGGFLVEQEKIPEVTSFEEGQSDIQKMIAKYEAIRKELDPEGYQDEIAAGEIVSVEEDEKAKAGRQPAERFFNPKKAIIYAEILKRKEY
jgi:hypothetical protein